MSVTLANSLRAAATAAAILLGSANLLSTAVAAGAEPHVSIDVSPCVECRDVTSTAFAASHPDEKIVTARFRVSVLLNAGGEHDLEQLQMTVDSPEQRLRVVDFQPRTELASELASDIEVCTSDNSIKSLNASLGGTLSQDHGVAQVAISPSGGVGITLNHGSKESYQRLSPKQLVLASGTTHAEHGVFFKWRRSSQATLEGSREVTCQFLVPADWRGDWVQVACEVSGKHRNYFGDKIDSCGEIRVLVGLYLAGDAAAEQAAYALLAAQCPPAAGSHAAHASSPQQHVAYKPTEARRGSSDWFSLPSMFKLCNNERSAEASAGSARAASESVARVELPTAIHELRKLSGTRP